MLTHFIDIRAAKPGILYDLYGRVMMAVHSSITEGAVLAIDWPQWQDQEGRFGFVMRVLGTPEGLFKALMKLTKLIEHQLLSCSELKTVPEDAKPQWMFVRERASSRFTPAYRRRLERRAAERGQPKQVPVGERKASHYLPMQSRSSQQAFALGILRVPVNEGACPAPTSYGLGIAIPSFEVSHA